MAYDLMAALDELDPMAVDDVVVLDEPALVDPLQDDEADEVYEAARQAGAWRARPSMYQR